MVDKANPGLNRDLDGLPYLDLSATSVPCSTIIAFTITSCLILCHNNIFWCFVKNIFIVFCKTCFSNIHSKKLTTIKLKELKKYHKMFLHHIDVFLGTRT